MKEDAMSLVVIVMVVVVEMVVIMLEDENLWKWKEMVSVLMVIVMALVMVVVMVLVMLVVMVMLENVWECREEEMTLLPEAVGAGMWKPEYEFPGMHCTALPNVRHSWHAVPAPTCSVFT